MIMRCPPNDSRCLATSPFLRTPLSRTLWQAGTGGDSGQREPDSKCDTVSFRAGVILRSQLCLFSAGRLDLAGVRQPLALSMSVEGFTREHYVRFQCFGCSPE